MSTKPSRISNDDIRVFADGLSMFFRESNEPGDLKLDLDRVLEALNVDVFRVQGMESSLVDENGRFHIFIPSMTSNRRDRFTISHEIGHYFLHYRLLPPESVKLPIKYGRGDRNRAETQANVFASSFLMPEKLFKDEYERLGGDSWAVAKSFDVSPAAAGVRAQVLDLA